jgi:ATP-dependent 26S proteasome regulatory subunit
LEAQRNALNSRVRLLREELKLLQEPGSYVGEVVKVMGKKKVLVKVQPEGKYGEHHFIYFLDQELCKSADTLSSQFVTFRPTSRSQS